MITIFWIATLFLFIFACGFVVPLLQSTRTSMAVIILFAGSVYGLYYYWGSSQFLPQYYSNEQKIFRARLPELQNLLAEFTKEEYRLRCRLEENPKDKDAEWRLLDLLAIKALNNGEAQLAKEYWIKAVEQMPEGSATLKKEIELRILKLKRGN